MTYRIHQEANGIEWLYTEESVAEKMMAGDFALEDGETIDTAYLDDDGILAVDCVADGDISRTEYFDIHDIRAAFRENDRYHAVFWAKGENSRTYLVCIA